jgi:hypothetical protein
MIFAYRQDRDTSDVASEQYILYVAEQTEAKAESGIPVVIFFSPPDMDLEKLVNKLGGMDSVQGKRFLRNHQKKVILFRDFGRRFNTNMLDSGRLPGIGSNEVIAESYMTSSNKINVGDQTLRIVGVLKKQNSLNQDAYYAFDDPALRAMLDPNGKALVNGSLVPWRDVIFYKSIENLMDEKKAFLQNQFTEVVRKPRLDRKGFYIYITGMFLLVFSGSALMIRGCMNAARRITNAWIGSPLAEINRHWKLFILLHAAFFGIVFVGMIMIYDMPMTQDFHSEILRGQIESKSGTPGLAGQAYGSGIIALAAVTTFVINFFPVSILQITLPSLIIPGIGVCMTIIHAGRLGIILSPAPTALAGKMLFHSFTLLLEGEGYILATFFALLVPIYLFSPVVGKKIRTRYWKALMINIKGNIIVLLVLGVSAIYEAIEIILQGKFAAFDAMFQMMR